MPRTDLPRYSVALTLSEDEIERLEEMAGMVGENGQPVEQTILDALVAYDVSLKGGVREFYGPSIFRRKP